MTASQDGPEAVEEALNSTCEWGGCPLHCCENRKVLAKALRAAQEKLNDAEKDRDDWEAEAKLLQGIEADYHREFVARRKTGDERDALAGRLKAAVEAHQQECGCPDEYGILCIMGKALEEHRANRD